MNIILSEHVEAFKKDGYFVTPVVFTEAQLRILRNECDRLQSEAIDRAESAGDAITIRENRLRFFQWQAHKASAEIAKAVKAQIFIEANNIFVGENVDLFTCLLAVKSPGTGNSFPWHQDAIYKVCEPLESLTAWTALDSATADNGCLWVIPGSHTRGLIPHEFNEIRISTALVSNDDLKRAIPLPMQAGQVAIFSSLLLHMTKENRSSDQRRATVFQYHRAGSVLKENGKTFGDQYPILRAGVAI